MRKLAIVLITVLAMGSLTATASAAAPNCSFTYGPDSVTATCDWPVYRVVAGCENPDGKWTAMGNRVTAGRGTSTATCKDGRAYDYSVQSDRSLLPPGCSAIFPFQVRDGYGIRAFCDGTYRVVVHCETLFRKWYAQGNVGGPGGRPSEAVCHGAVLTDYYVEIV